MKPQGKDLPVVKIKPKEKYIKCNKNPNVPLPLK